MTPAIHFSTSRIDSTFTWQRCGVPQSESCLSLAYFAVSAMRRGVSFALLATSAFVDYSIHTQEFLRKIRVKP